MNAADRPLRAPHVLWLLLVLAAGLWLRTIGFSWGLPLDKFPQTQTFYPDEQLVFITLKGMDPSRRNFRPSPDGALLALGPAYAYLVGAAAWAAQKTGWLSVAAGPGRPNSLEDVRRLYRLGRGINVALGLATIALLFVFGAKVLSPAAGLLGALMLALLPLHVFFCQTMARDIAQLFFWALSLCFLSGVKRSDESAAPACAGIFLGLSAACKYSSLLLVLSLPMGLWLLARRENLSAARFLASKGLLFSLAGVLAGYLLGNPYSLLAFPDFLAEFATSLRAVGGLRGSDAFQAGGGWKFYGLDAWRFGCGPVLSVLFAAGFLRAIFRRDRWDWILLAAIVPYLAATMASNARFVRYLTPVLPAALFWSVRLAREFWSHSFRKGLPVYRQTLIASALWMVLIITGRYSWSFAGALNAPDARVAASEWIRAHVPEGSSIGTASTPYFHHPNILGQHYWHPGTAAGAGYRVVNLNFSRDALKKASPDFIALSDYDYFPLETMGPVRARNHPRWEFLNEIFNAGVYRAVARFEKDLTFYSPRGGKPFFPHDWRYPFPSIVIFERSDAASRREGMTLP